jgi:hypothetical protein
MQFLLLVGSLLASMGPLVSLVSGDGKLPAPYIHPSVGLWLIYSQAAGLRNLGEAVAIREVKRAVAPRCE